MHIAYPQLGKLQKRFSYHKNKPRNLETIKTFPFPCCCDDNKIKMVRKPGKKQKENPVACTIEGKR